VATRGYTVDNEDGYEDGYLRHSSVDLDDVRNLHLRYSHAKHGDPELTVEFVGGRTRVFAVDRFLIERLLEHLEEWG
jgi:hypothetical protein